MVGVVFAVLLLLDIVVWQLHQSTVHSRGVRRFVLVFYGFQVMACLALLLWIALNSTILL